MERMRERGRECEYTTVEISKPFADMQRSKNLNVIEGSFMDIQIVEPRPASCLPLRFGTIWRTTGCV